MTKSHGIGLPRRVFSLAVSLWFLVGVYLETCLCRTLLLSPATKDLRLLICTSIRCGSGSPVYLSPSPIPRIGVDGSCHAQYVISVCGPLSAPSETSHGVPAVMCHNNYVHAVIRSCIDNTHNHGVFGRKREGDGDVSMVETNRDEA